MSCCKKNCSFKRADDAAQPQFVYCWLCDNIMHAKCAGLSGRDCDKLMVTSKKECGVVNWSCPSVAIDNSIDTHNSCNEKDFTTLQEKLYSHQQNKQQTDPGSGPGVPALPETDTLTPSPSSWSSNGPTLQVLAMILPRPLIGHFKFSSRCRNGTIAEVLSFLDDEVLLRIYPEDSGTAGIHWPVTNNHHVVHRTPQLWLNDSRPTQ
ncbi:hypothetical protein ACLKA6_003264 [Drosophila palustris]